MTTTNNQDHRDVVFKQKGMLRTEVRKALKSMDPVLRSQKVLQVSDSVDLLLLPGLAFDRSGRRLGQGGGKKKKKKRGQQAAGGDKNGRGLCQFTMKVCEKVESKGRTTYNEDLDAHQLLMGWQRKLAHSISRLLGRHCT